MAQLRPTDYTVQDAADEELLTGEAVALDLRPASLVLRAAGSAIDLILYLGTYILGMIVFLSAAVAALDNALVSAVATVGLVIFVVAVPITVELLSHGRSLGKLAVGARIVRDDGGAIGFRHAFIRALIGVLEIFGTLGGLALLVAFFNPKAKRLGDMLAGTYSQYERVPQFNAAVFGVPVQLLEWAKTADVARMPDPLARRIAHFLAQASRLSPDSRDRLGRDLANEAAPYVSPVPFAPAELFLAGVAAVRREREFAGHQLERARLQKLQPVLTGLPHRFPQRGPNSRGL
jgi:uncharacterized RDD family membrane protein YckC